jgi:hypothetical protein
MNRKTKMKIYSIATAMTPNSKSLVARFCVCDVMFSLHVGSMSKHTTIPAHHRSRAQAANPFRTLPPLRYYHYYNQNAISEDRMRMNRVQVV